MVSKVILSCVVFGFVLVSCNGLHTSTLDRSLLEAEDMDRSFHKLNTDRSIHGMSHDMLRENKDSTYWMTSGNTRDEALPMRMPYKNQPEDDNSRKYERVDNNKRSRHSHNEDERTNERHVMASDFKSSLEADDDLKFAPMRSDMDMRKSQHMNRRHHQHRHDDFEESYNMESQSHDQVRHREPSMKTKSYQPGRKISLVTSQEQSRESSEGLQVQKVRHNTDPQEAGNARRKTNYIQLRGQGSHDVNSSPEDVANKIYKKNN